MWNGVWLAMNPDQRRRFLSVDALEKLIIISSAPGPYNPFTYRDERSPEELRAGAPLEWAFWPGTPPNAPRARMLDAFLR